MTNELIQLTIHITKTYIMCDSLYVCTVQQQQHWNNWKLVYYNFVTEIACRSVIIPKFNQRQSAHHHTLSFYHFELNSLSEIHLPCPFCMCQVSFECFGYSTADYNFVLSTTPTAKRSPYL